jgi:hypothetical protein
MVRLIEGNGEESMDQIQSVIIESLPAIDIAVGAERLLFLERIINMGDDGRRIAIERHQLALGEDKSHFVNLILPGTIGCLKTGGQLIVNPNETRVRVEMYSACWEADRPTRIAYIEFAQAFFGPILKRYNHRFGTRHRLRVVKTKDYDMPPKTKLLFDRFAILANVRSLHTLDWERFYLFVRNSRREVPEGLLRPMLIEKGFAADKAEMLSELYHHLWRFKKLAAN